MSGASKNGPLRKLTVLLDASLERSLMSERDRIAASEGIKVTLTAIATRAMRAGFSSAEPPK